MGKQLSAVMTIEQDFIDQIVVTPQGIDVVHVEFDVIRSSLDNGVTMQEVDVATTVYHLNMRIKNGDVVIVYGVSNSRTAQNASCQHEELSAEQARVRGTHHLALNVPHNNQLVFSGQRTVAHPGDMEGGAQLQPGAGRAAASGRRAAARQRRRRLVVRTVHGNLPPPPHRLLRRGVRTARPVHCDALRLVRRHAQEEGDPQEERETDENVQRGA